MVTLKKSASIRKLGKKMPEFLLIYSTPILLVLSGLIPGALIAWLVTWLWARSRGHRQEEAYQLRYTAQTEQREAAEKRIADLIRELDQGRRQLEARWERITDLSARMAALEQENTRIVKLEASMERAALEKGDHLRQIAALEAKLAQWTTRFEEADKRSREKMALLTETRESFRSEFENLANRIFEEKGLRYAELGKKGLEEVLSPLRQQIDGFRRRIEDVYDHETRDRISMLGEIGRLKELNRRIGEDAVNLTKALKGDTKAQGIWGEVILERVLESSGLTRGREYDLQVSLSTGGSDGRRYQPDAVIRLPHGKDVIVDAKVSLTAYERLNRSQSKADRKAALGEHITSIRNHIRTLAVKNYQELEGLRSLDYVLMFIPIEAAFVAAMEPDASLMDEALARNVVLVCPATLMAALRTIENTWRSENQNRNALEIAKQAAGLFDKFVGFAEALEEIGKQLTRAQGAWQTARDRLVTGRGNLIKRTRDLKALGLKTKKELSPELEKDADL